MTNAATAREILKRIRDAIDLNGKMVLEIGCGEGERSVEIAPFCEMLTVVDPDPDKLKKAQEKAQESSLSNVVMRKDRPDALAISSKAFDVVIFTLALKDVRADTMKRVIDEARRVVKPDGFIVFVEPRVFNREPTDDAYKRAYRSITGHKDLTLFTEMSYGEWWIAIYHGA